MLMRSASTPALNSLNRTSTDHSSYLFSPSPEPEFFHRSAALLPRLKPVSFSPFSPGSSPYSDHYSRSPMCRSISATDLRSMAVASIPRAKSFAMITEDRDDEDSDSDSDFHTREDYWSTNQMIMTSTGLGESRSAFLQVDDHHQFDDVCEVEANRMKLSLLVGGGGGDINGGGKRCVGGGGRGDDYENDGGLGKSNSGATDKHYLKMIEADPGNSLVLGNYARYLKEVKNDLIKAEEYCGRAILANPNDGIVLAMYADLIWKNHRDASRAEMYFEQAVRAAPSDSFVAASYAGFLWDMEEEDEEVGEDENVKDSVQNSDATILQGLMCHHHHPTPLPPLAAT